MCNEEEESINHLFLQCRFARAIWLRSNLGMRTSDLVSCSVKLLVESAIMDNTTSDANRMFLLQSMFTILWSIWNHRNLTLNQGKMPNPKEVILTAQSFICRYQKAFSLDAQQNNRFKHQQVQNFTNQNWQIILKVAAFKNNRTKRSGFAYQALNQKGAIILSGGSSCGKKKHYLALQEAVSEGVFKAKELGFNRVLILSTSKGFDQFCNHTRKPDWMEKTLCSDLQQLKFQGLLVNHLLVPRIVISHVLKLAYITTACPVHHCRLNPDYVLAS